MTERWLPVSSFDGYEVSDLGRIRSWRCNGRHAGKIRKTPLVKRNTVSKSGYARISFPFEGKKKIKFVHHLVLEAFVGPRPAGHECAHGDGNTLNNNLINLRWATKPGNASDKSLHGTKLMGEAVHNAKLTEQIVREIRQSPEMGTVVAARCGVSKNLVSHVRLRKVWKHVA